MTQVTDAQLSSQNIADEYYKAGYSALPHRRVRKRRHGVAIVKGRIENIHSLEEFRATLDRARDALVCVTFSAKWCGPWRMVKPDVHMLSHIHGDVFFYEVDVDDNEDIATVHRVVCMPTFQFFKSGHLIDKFAEPNRIKLDETIRKLRRLDVRLEDR